MDRWPACGQPTAGVVVVNAAPRQATLRRALRRVLLPIGLLAVALILVLNLPRWLMPARVVPLTGTEWNVESIGGVGTSHLNARITFARDAAYLDSTCGRRTFGWSHDTDGTDLGFWTVSTQPLGCTDQEGADEEKLAAALPLTTHWYVETEDVVELRGEMTIRLRRLDLSTSHQSFADLGTTRARSTESRLRLADLRGNSPRTMRRPPEPLESHGAAEAIAPPMMHPGRGRRHLT